MSFLTYTARNVATVLGRRQLNASIGMPTTSQRAHLQTGNVLQSDALFVHRENDPNVDKFEFTEENLKVNLNHTLIDCIDCILMKRDRFHCL